MTDWTCYSSLVSCRRHSPTGRTSNNLLDFVFTTGGQPVVVMDVAADRRGFCQAGQGIEAELDLVKAER